MHLKLTLNRSTINPGQWKFLLSKARTVLLSGGFGSGKTTALALKLLQLKAANPNTPGLLVAQSYKALWSITFMRLMATLRRVLPPDRMPRVKDKNGACYLDFGDGVPIYLRTATNPSSIDGLDVGWALGDELRHWPKATYEVLLGRVRVRCPMPQIAFASTPEMHWMADDFFYRRNEERELIIAPTIENERNLAPGFIDNMRLSYSKRLQKVVIDGHFAILEGAVFESLDVDIWNSQWVVDHDPEAKKWQKTYLAVDPGYRRSSWLWIHEDRRRMRWVVFDQFMGERMSDNECINVVNERGWPIDEIWVDPAADNTQSVDGWDTLDALSRVFNRSPDPIRVIENPFTSISWGVDKMRTLYGDPEIGQPTRLRFARRLRELEEGKERGVVKDTLSYRYPEMKDDRPVGNTPLKDGRTDHSNDALRYWGVGMWLSNPKLRELDKTIGRMSNGRDGWRVHAA